MGVHMCLVLLNKSLEYSSSLGLLPARFRQGGAQLHACHCGMPVEFQEDKGTMLSLPLLWTLHLHWE